MDKCNLCLRLIRLSQQVQGLLRWRKWLRTYLLVQETKKRWVRPLGQKDSPGEGNGVTKSWTQLKRLNIHTHNRCRTGSTSGPLEEVTLWAVFAVWPLEWLRLVCTNRIAGVGWSSPCSHLSPEKWGSPQECLRCSVGTWAYRKASGGGMAKAGHHQWMKEPRSFNSWVELMTRGWVKVLKSW